MTESALTDDAATSGPEAYRVLPDAVRLEDTLAEKHEPFPVRPGGVDGLGFGSYYLGDMLGLDLSDCGGGGDGGGGGD